MTVLRPDRTATARILIFRDDAVHRAIELGSRVVTIGRGAQNDVVLDDPNRTISRFHAEVRPEDGRYVLVDLGSQNGTWSEEKRIDRIELKRGTPVTIGPYRLIFDDTPVG